MSKIYEKYSSDYDRDYVREDLQVKKKRKKKKRYDKRVLSVHTYDGGQQGGPNPYQTRGPESDIGDDPGGE